MEYKVINLLGITNCDKLGLATMSENKFRRNTNFTIEHILMKNGVAIDKCENNDNLDLTCKRMEFGGSYSETTKLYRPLNKVLESPWCSKGPLMFNPKVLVRNISMEIKEESLSQSPTAPNPYDCGYDFRYQNLVLPVAAIVRPEILLPQPKPAVAPLQSSPSSFKCANCDKTFDCLESLKEHEKCHKVQRFECTECGKFFSQLRNYKYHLSVHRGTKEYAANCTVCGKMFNDKGYLSSHMKIHRNKKEYQCSFCPKSFNQRVAYNMHVRIHTGVKPHKCECGKRFSRKMLLKQHLRTHTGEKPYQCSVCLKTFADRSNMILHHRLHSGIKPFSCDICPKSFTKKHHLTTHLNYHNGFKPYICPHENCGQSFTQSSNMRTHAKKCQHKVQS